MGSTAALGLFLASICGVTVQVVDETGKPVEGAAVHVVAEDPPPPSYVPDKVPHSTDGKGLTSDIGPIDPKMLKLRVVGYAGKRKGSLVIQRDGERFKPTVTLTVRLLPE